jgi:hypothetical protein
MDSASSLLECWDDRAGFSSLGKRIAASSRNLPKCCGLLARLS